MIAASALTAAARTGAGWVKKKYIFARFVADYVLAAGFDGIHYGATKHGVGCNYVLLAAPGDISAVAAMPRIEPIVA